MLLSEIDQRLVILTFDVLVLVVIVGVPVFAIVSKRRGSRRLDALIEEAQAATQHSSDVPVRLRFHTYHGVLIFCIQTRHELVLPYRHAQNLLNQLHRFNMTWGFFAYGALLIPILSYLQFKSESASILQQAGRKSGW